MAKRIFLDFDKTLVDSLTAEYHAANKMGIDFEYWHMQAQLSKNEEHLQFLYKKIYQSDYFWENLIPFADTIQTLKELKNRGVYIIINSIGTPGNLIKKIECLERHFKGLYDEFLLSYSEHTYVGKEIINMEGAIFVDDKLINLKSTNAELKILMGISDDDSVVSIKKISEILNYV